MLRQKRSPANRRASQNRGITSGGGNRENANEQAGQIVDKAKKDHEVEREQTMREMKSQIADIALTAASKIWVRKQAAKEIWHFMTGF